MISSSQKKKKKKKVDQPKISKKGIKKDTENIIMTQSKSTVHPYVVLVTSFHKDTVELGRLQRTKNIIHI